MSERFRERLRKLADDAAPSRPALDDLRRLGRRRLLIRRVGTGVAVSAIAIAIVVPLVSLRRLSSDDHDPAAELSSGGSLVFSRKTDQVYGLWLVRPDGSDLHPIDVPLPMATDPVWSPDGSTIAFSGGDRRNSEPFALFTVHPDGSGFRQVTSTADGIWDLDPAWSPDGRQLLFARLAAPPAGDGTSDLVTLNLEDATERVVPLPEDFRQVTEPAWSPDGTRIAFIGNRDGVVGPYLVAVDGSDLKPLLPDRQSGEDGVQAISWSPDGTTIAFAQDADVWVTSLVDGGVRQLTDDPDLDTAPSWSPDGSRLAFLTNRDVPEPDCLWTGDQGEEACGASRLAGWGDLDVFVMNADGTGQQAVTDGGRVGYSPMAPSSAQWQPVAGSQPVQVPDASTLTAVDTGALWTSIDELGWEGYVDQRDERLALWADAAGVEAMDAAELASAMDILTGSVAERPAGSDSVWLREILDRRTYLCTLLPPDHEYRGGEYCD